MRDSLKEVYSSSFNIRRDCCRNDVLIILRVNIDQKCFSVCVILTFSSPRLVPEYLPPLETQQKAWRHLGGEIATS